MTLCDSGAFPPLTLGRKTLNEKGEKPEGHKYLKEVEKSRGNKGNIVEGEKVHNNSDLHYVK